MHLLLQSADGAHDLVQDDLTHEAPEIAALQPGEHVVARVQYGSVAFPAQSLWELKTASHTVLSYATTYAHAKREKASSQTAAIVFGAASAVALSVGLLLRVHSGAWRGAI